MGKNYAHRLRQFIFVKEEDEENSIGVEDPTTEIQDIVFLMGTATGVDYNAGSTKINVSGPGSYYSGDLRGVPPTYGGFPPPGDLPPMNAGVGSINYHWQSRQSHPAFDTVVQHARRYNVPLSLVEAVMYRESKWRPNLTSSAGAYGYMQLMPGAARDMGVDRYNPSENIRGGIKYIDWLLNQPAVNQDIFYMLAAYNWGIGRVSNRASSGRPLTLDSLPGETRKYIIIIMTRMALQPRPGYTREMVLQLEHGKDFSEEQFSSDGGVSSSGTIEAPQEEEAEDSEKEDEYGEGYQMSGFTFSELMSEGPLIDKGTGLRFESYENEKPVCKPSNTGGFDGKVEKFKRKGLAAGGVS